MLRWGLVPRFTKDIKTARRQINARAETVASSGMFAGAFRARRCIVPADAFCEWKAIAGGKQPYPLAFAGLWEGWRNPEGETLRTFAVVTTGANAIMSPIHDRMPVILEPVDWPAWLGETPGEASSLLAPPPMAWCACGSSARL